MIKYFYWSLPLFLFSFRRYKLLGIKIEIIKYCPTWRVTEKGHKKYKQVPRSMGFKNVTIFRIGLLFLGLDLPLLSSFYLSPDIMWSLYIIEFLVSSQLSCWWVWGGEYLFRFFVFFFFPILDAITNSLWSLFPKLAYLWFIEHNEAPQHPLGSVSMIWRRKTC